MSLWFEVENEVLGQGLVGFEEIGCPGFRLRT